MLVRRLPPLLLAVLLVAVGLLTVARPLPAAAAPTTVTFNPVADSYTEQANPTSNFGTATTLALGASAGIPNVYSFLKFNVSVPAGKTITSASLKLRIFSSSTTGYTIRTATDTTWQESTLTWNTQPTVNPTPESAASGAVTSGTDVTLTATSLIPARGGAATLVLRTTGSRFSVRSREQVATPPELSVTYDTATGTSATSSFTATADNYISSTNPDTNNGTVDTLRITDATGKIRTFLRFNVSGLAGRVTAASLKLYVKGGQTLTQEAKYKVSPATDPDWTETGLTHNTRPPWSTSSFVTSAALNTPNVATTGHYETVDVLPLVAGNGEVDLVIECTCTNTGGINFHSRENTDTPSRKPVLEVTVDGIAADPEVALAGDISCPTSDNGYNSGNGAVGECHQKYTANVVTSDPDITDIITAGDHQYEDNLAVQFQNAYTPSWGKVWAKTHPGTGNHEYQTSGASGYYGYWLDKANGSVSLTSTGQAGDCVASCLGYDSFDVGTWHVIQLNAQCGKNTGDLGSGACGSTNGVDSAQLDWLQADLAAHPDTCTMAVFHQPRYATPGSHNDDLVSQSFWKELYNAGADVIVSGHNHMYERFAPQKPASATGAGTADDLYGIREFVSGAGGRDHELVSTPDALSLVRVGDVFGVLKLALHPGSYDWNWTPEVGNPGNLPDNGDQIADGTPQTDSGTDVCHGTPAAPIP